MTREPIFPDKRAKAIAPISPAVRSDRLIYVSGEVGLDHTTGRIVDGGLEAQAEQIFHNLSATLAAAGKDFSHVIRVGIYLTDMAKFAAMNSVYARHFSEPYPARTTIAVAALPLGAEVEIDLVVGD
jgi:2-iminobutanoate/2-iminopropanoate deaminase